MPDRAAAPRVRVTFPTWTDASGALPVLTWPEYTLEGWEPEQAVPAVIRYFSDYDQQGENMPMAVAR